MKKFYKLVSVGEVPGGYVIQLDGKPVQTPARVPLVAPNKALAEELSGEWAAQDETIDPETMPLTQILTTMQDHVASQRPAMTEKLLHYLDTDLLCYRTEIPEALAARQAECWDVWLGWFARIYGAGLQTTTGLAALKQPQEAAEAVGRAVESLGDGHFCVLQMVTGLSGSLVLGLAFLEGAATPDQVFEAANIEERYKYEICNEAEHGAAPQQEKQQAALRRDLIAARKFLDLL